MDVKSTLDLLTLTELDLKMIGVGTIFIFALYAALKTALFKPLLRHLEEREGVTAGANFTADQMRQKAQSLRQRYDDDMLQARISANKERMEAVAKAKASTSAIVAEAESQAAKELKAGRQAIDQALKEAYLKAEGEARVLADTLTSKVDHQLTH